jgi:hypothetical protein
MAQQYTQSVERRRRGIILFAAKVAVVETPSLDIVNVFEIKKHVQVFD